MPFDVTSFAAGRKAGGGGGGSKIITQPLNVTENGIYDAPSGYAYTPVDVNVQPDLQEKEIDIEDIGQYIVVPDSDYYGLSKVKVNVDIEEYDGPYEAESEILNDTTFETQGKLMTDDFVVKKVTVLEVSNISGGYTVSIGK